MNKINSILSLDREDMSDFERELFLKDLQRVTDEYFECENASLEVTRADDGFIVCVLFTARRIKNIKKPQ
ncbi:MAG: hypothetical protein K2L12_05055 [Clostridia bacterium]|nr:hypothetical protein [Clostridia bacterium]